MRRKTQKKGKGTMYEFMERVGKWLESPECRETYNLRNVQFRQAKDSSERIVR